MEERIIKTKLVLEGAEAFKNGINALCADLDHLGSHIDAVNNSVAQLNKSLVELMELRKQSL